MSFLDSAAGGGGDPGGDPAGGGGASPVLAGQDGPDDNGGLLSALQQQQQGPAPSAPGEGTQANAMMLLQNAIQMIQKAAMGLPAGSPMHRDATRAVGSLSRHLSQGQPTAGVQQTQLSDLLRMVAKSGLLQMLRGQGGDQNGDAGQAPMPSTPLPGS